MRVKLCSLISAASLMIFAALAGTATAATAPSGPPTAIGTGGAAASVEPLATQAAIDILRRAATPSMRRSPPPPCSASPSRSGGIGGGGFFVIRDRDAQVTPSTAARPRRRR